MLSSKLQAAQERFRQRIYPHFAWVINETAPWTPVTKPLAQSCIALLSTCGLYRADTQLPFDAWNVLGDPSFREIHVDTPADRLCIAHTHYDHKPVAADVEVSLPIKHFRHLAEAGVIGRLHPWAYSFMGYLPEPRQLITETAPQVARRLLNEGVDAAFLTSC
ncbi:MAG: glycine/sarcosine/betaine reductase selenoprotein B family protein [Anaerolineae bacterium]